MHFFDIWTSKKAQNHQSLTLLTSKCASCHNGVRFFDISTSKWSEHVVLLTFWLGNVLRATTACTFSTSQLPKVVRTWGAFYILTWKCALRHNGVQLFMSHLARWLRTRRFSEVTFRPSGTANHWKKRTCIFFLLTFSPLWSSHFFSSPLWLFPSPLFHLSILLEVWLLNFLR